MHKNFDQERFDRVVSRLSEDERHALHKTSFAIDHPELVIFHEGVHECQKEALIVVCDSEGQANAIWFLMRRSLAKAIDGLFICATTGFLQNGETRCGPFIFSHAFRTEIDE